MTTNDGRALLVTTLFALACVIIIGWCMRCQGERPPQYSPETRARIEEVME